MEPSPFASLSPELVLAIGETLSLEEQKQFRLTCPTLAKIFAELVLHSIRILDQRDRIVDHASSLKYLTDSGSAICLYTKSITIGAPRSRDGFYTESDEDQEALKLSDPERDHIRDNIVAGLLACKSLRRVVLYKAPGEPACINCAVLKAINTSPTLRDIDVTSAAFENGFDFEKQTALESLSVSITSSYPRVLEDLPKIITSSSNLTSLTIYNPWSYSAKFTRAHSLHSLLQGLSNDRPFYRLSLDGLLVRFDSRTLPHLKSLVSLRIKNRMFPSDEAKEEYREVCSPSDELWKALHTSGIHLQELEHDYVSDSLTRYLSSFTGLRTLRLDVQSFDDEKIADAAAVDFFSRAFPSHTATLENLAIDSPYEGQWCFGPDSLQNIAQCGRLKRLSVTMNSSELERNLGEQDELPDTDAMKQFIDMAATHMPELEMTCVQPASLNAFRGSWCGTSAVSYAHSAYQRMTKNIELYRAPREIRHLPSLHVSRWSRSVNGELPWFSGVVDFGGSGRLMYVKSPTV